MENFTYRLIRLAQLVYAVITGLLWMLVPPSIRTRFERPFQRKGLRIVTHEPYFGRCGNPNAPFVYTINFGSGCGYRGGATLYLAFGGCRVRAVNGYWRPQEAFTFGLTNGDTVPLVGRWS